MYVYQAIEVRLKYLLPHLVAPGEDTPAEGEGFANWRVFLDSKSTLGPLIQRLKERIETTEPELVESAWGQIVQYRNEIMHHFVEQPFARMQTDEEFTKAMKFLQVRRRAALPLLNALQDILFAFADIIRPGGILDDNNVLH